MKESDLLEVHHQDPLAARWFSLASYCLKSGCQIVTYDATSFRAEVADASAANQVTGYFEAQVQDGGGARWTWAWTRDDASPSAALEQEAGESDSWTQVLSDWRNRALAA